MKTRYLYFPAFLLLLLLIPNGVKAQNPQTVRGDVRAQQGSPPQYAQNQRALRTSDSADRSAVARGTPSVHEVEVSGVRISNTDNCVEMTIELGGRVQYQAARLSESDRIYFDIKNARLSNELQHQPIRIPSGRCLKAVRMVQYRPDVVRVVLRVAQAKIYSVSESANPDRLVVDIHGASDNTAVAANSAPETSAQATALAPGVSAPGARGEPAAPTTAPGEIAPEAVGPLPLSVKASPSPSPAPISPGDAMATVAPPPSPKTVAEPGARGEPAAPTTAPGEIAPGAAGPLPLSVKASPSLSPAPISPGDAMATVAPSPSPKTVADQQGPPPASQPTPARSSQDRQTLRGDVRAPDSSVIADATVTLTGEGQEKPLTSETEEDGTFEFSKVPSGSYVLRVNSTGFEPVEMPVTVGSEPVPQIRVKLKIAEVAEKVTVSAQSVLVAEENPSQAQFDERAVMNLPARDADPLAVPSLFLNPAVNGANGPTIIVDGVETSALDMPTSGVKTVAVDQNPYSAEFGRPGKGRLEVTTRHGARSRYRGNVLALVRNSALDARNALATERPLQQREIGEAELDGPLGPHQTTFFLAARYHVFNNSSTVHATTPEGILVDGIPTPGGTFIENVRVPERRASLFARTDTHFGPAHTLSFLYKFKDSQLENQDIGGLTLPDRAKNVSDHENQAKVLETETRSSNFQNQVRLSYKAERQHTSSVFPDPAVNILGNAEFGGAQTNRQVIENLGDAQDVATLFYGRHNLQFGAGAKVRDIEAEDSSNFGGTFVFSTLADFQPPPQPSGFQPPPQPSKFAMNSGNPSVSFRQHEIFAFLQDEMRLLPNFSLMAGLRYEFEPGVSDYQNLAPRLAMVYSPGSDHLALRDTVLRGGFGVFYDRQPYQMLEDSLLYNGSAIHQVVLSCPQNCPSYPQPFPPGTPPTAVPPSIMQIDPLIYFPYVMQGSFAIERRLEHRLGSLAVEFSAVRGVHLYRMRNLNAPLPGTPTPPNPNFVNLDQFESYGSSRNNAVAVTYKGEVHKLSVMAQYVFSRSLDDTSGYTYIPSNSYDPGADWGRSDLDRRHRFNLVLMYPTRYGFHVSGIVNVWSGLPYNITTGKDDNNDTVFNDRPSGVSRNTGEGGGYTGVDLRVSKRWRLWQKEHAHFVEVSWDAFNIFNHVNYEDYNGVQSSPTFGQPYTANPARQLQISVRYHF